MNFSETVILVQSENDCRIDNASQALHGALFNALWGTELDEFHQKELRSPFSLSPLYSTKGKISGRFNAGGTYVFRFASGNNNISEKWIDKLMISGSLELQRKRFWIKSLETWTSNLQEIKPCSDVEMFFISPVSFRKSQGVDLSIPCPDYIQNHFSLFSSITGEESCELKLTMLEGKTIPLKFKNHLLIGFVGRIKLSFDKSVKYPLLTHFYGLGHNCAMGMGSTIVREISAPERVSVLWREFNWLPEK
ncbi:MAG: hypothetical protein GXX80_11310 [Thermotogaceae bacterium]|nr:hypothetical protein [Thermotogaceae bacterium]